MFFLNFENFIPLNLPILPLPHSFYCLLQCQLGFSFYPPYHNLFHIYSIPFSFQFVFHIIFKSPIPFSAMKNLLFNLPTVFFSFLNRFCTFSQISQYYFQILHILILSFIVCDDASSWWSIFSSNL